MASISGETVESVEIWPNPADGLVNLEWKNFEEKPVKIAIVNTQGQVVYQTLTGDRLTDNIEIPTGQLRSGFYSVVLTFPQKSIAKKLIVGH
jgi:Secretion system C-terminal sorting domain